MSNSLDPNQNRRSNVKTVCKCYLKTTNVVTSMEIVKIIMHKAQAHDVNCSILLPKLVTVVQHCQLVSIVNAA